MCDLIELKSNLTKCKKKSSLLSQRVTSEGDLPMVHLLCFRNEHVKKEEMIKADISEEKPILFS